MTGVWSRDDSPTQKISFLTKNKKNVKIDFL